MLVQQQIVILFVSNINDRVVFGETPNRKKSTFDIVPIILASPENLFVSKSDLAHPLHYDKILYRGRKNEKPFSVFPRLQPHLLLSVYCQTNFEGNNRVFQMSPHFELGTQ